MSFHRAALPATPGRDTHFVVIDGEVHLPSIVVREVVAVGGVAHGDLVKPDGASWRTCVAKFHRSSVVKSRRKSGRDETSQCHENKVIFVGIVYVCSAKTLPAPETIFPAPFVRGDSLECSRHIAVTIRG